MAPVSAKTWGQVGERMSELPVRISGTIDISNSTKVVDAGVESLNAKTHRCDSSAVVSSDDSQESGQLFTRDLRHRLG